MRVGVSCIPGNVEEIAVVGQFESRRLDLRECSRAVMRHALAEMRQQLIERLGRRIEGGNLALLGSVTSAIAAIDASARVPAEAEAMARAVVTDMPGEPINLALYAGDSRVTVVQLGPQRAIHEPTKTRSTRRGFFNAGPPPGRRIR